MRHSVLPAFLLALVVAAAATRAADAPQCLLRAGDLWVCLGDSITNADTYRRTLQRVAEHYYPDAGIRFVNGGKPGALASGTKEQFEAAAVAERPTVVSIMTGMNNSINSAWRFGQPLEPALASYRQSLTTSVRKIREKGIAVVLMSPTLTDESLGWGTMWEVRGTAEFLRRAGDVVREVAAAEGALFVPVGAEFEAAQAALPPECVLRPDAVHPAAAGQYAIARSLVTHCGFGAPLGTGERRLSAPATAAPVAMALDGRLVPEGETKLTLTLKTAAPGPATIAWSCGAARGRQEVTLTGADPWTLDLPPAVAALTPGQAEQLLVEVRRGDARQLALVDLCRTRVLHVQDGRTSGTIAGKEGRADGQPAVTWTLRPAGKGLLLEADVRDGEICAASDWPWARDGLTLWLDVRPAARFASINPDCDVHQILLNVRAQPAFMTALRGWLGRGLDAAASLGGDPTPTGYKLRFLLDGKFAKHLDADFSTRDLIGINLVHVDLDTVNGKPQPGFSSLQTTQYAHDQYANNLVIVDASRKLPGDTVLTANLTSW